MGATVDQIQGHDLKLEIKMCLKLCETSHIACMALARL